MRKLLMMLGLLLSGATMAQTTVQVETKNGISVALNGADTLSVFGVTNAYEVTDTTFKVLYCVAPKGSINLKDIEMGVCYSSQTETLTLDGDVYFMKSNSNSHVHTMQLRALGSGTDYWYRVYVKYADGKVAYGKVYNATTLGSKGDKYERNPYTKIVNGHTFIDLGLPSGLCWATYNVGAKSETDKGGYYGWGSTSFNSGSPFYNVEYVGNLKSTDDTATKLWGEGTRMATIDEFSELAANCTSQWVTNYKGSTTNGRIYVGPNGQSVFFPAGGVYDGYNRYSDGKGGLYWTSTADNSNESCSKEYSIRFGFDSSSKQHGVFGYSRKLGQNVRAVTD